MALYTPFSADYDEVDDGNSGASKTINFSSRPNHIITLTANTTLTLVMPPHDYRCQLRVVQDGTGSRLITFAGPTFRWGGGAAPVLSTGAAAEDIITFFCKVSGAANRVYGVVKDFA